MVGSNRPGRAMPALVRATAIDPGSEFFSTLFAARAGSHGQASGVDPPALGTGDMVARPAPICWY